MFLPNTNYALNAARDGLRRRALQRAVKGRAVYSYDLRGLGRRPASVDELARMGQPVALLQKSILTKTRLQKMAGNRDS